MARPKYLELKPDDLKRVTERKEQEESTKITPEWRLLAEFGSYYGWSAVEAVMNNDVSIDVFNRLLSGARKVWAGQLIDLSTIVYTSLVASNSKKPQIAMNKGLAQFMKEVRL